MNLRRLTVIACLLLSAGSAPALSQPTVQSVERLLTLSRAEAIVAQGQAQMEAAMRQAMRNQLVQRGIEASLTAEQQRVVDDMAAQLSTLLGEELSWPNLKPEFVTLYRETLSQQEVDGIAAFYETPIGQAMLDKMPQVLQRSIALTMSRMQALMPRIEAIAAEAARKLKAAGR
jgi:hypothetical protein